MGGGLLTLYTHLYNSISNRVDQVIPAAVLADATAKIDAAIELLAPYLETLIVEKRQDLPKMGDKTVNFVTKASECTSTLPTLIPSYLDAEGLRLDAGVYAELLPIYQRLDVFLRQVTDTRMLASHEGYAVALSVYQALRAAARNGQPGAQAAVDELKVRFAAQGNRSPRRPGA